MQNPRLIGLALTLVVALSTGCSVCLLSPPPPRSYSVSLRDVDGDGDLDAVVGNGPGNAEYAGEPNAVWLNDGAGHFTDSGQRIIGSGGTVWSITYAVALGDLDGDGDLDAFIGNARSGRADEVWVHDGTGAFTDSEQRLGEANTRILAPALLHPAMNTFGNAFAITPLANVLFIGLAVLAIVSDRMWEKLPADHPAVHSELAPRAHPTLLWGTGCCFCRQRPSVLEKIGPRSEPGHPGPSGCRPHRRTPPFAADC